MQSDSQIEKQLIKDLINNLKEVSSFGYKIIVQRQFDLLSNWYSELHDKKIVISYENTKFFAEPTVMYAYFVLGLSKAGDKILAFDTLSIQISKTVSSLGRQWLKMQLIGQIEQNELQIEEKVKKCEIFIFGNPDICSGQYVSENKINMIMRMCMKHQKIIIVDQSQAQSAPNPTTFLGFQYDKLVVIRKIGVFTEKIIRPKLLAVYGGKQISSMRYAASKSLKILPSQLILQLIKTSTSDLSKHEYKRIQGIMRQNIDTLHKLLPEQWSPYKKWNKMGRYYLLDVRNMDKKKIKQIKQLTFKFKQIQICASDKIQSSFIVLDLTQQCQAFKRSLDELFFYAKL